MLTAVGEMAQQHAGRCARTGVHGGGQEVMRAQLGHLIEAAGRPDITIQVIPFAAGWHPALYGMFWIFRFSAQELPDVV